MDIVSQYGFPKGTVIGGTAQNVSERKPNGCARWPNQMTKPTNKNSKKIVEHKYWFNLMNACDMVTY